MAGSTRQSREVKKWLAARRAQLRLKQAFDRIDYEEDVLLPEVEAMLSGKVKLEIEAGSDAASQSIISVTVSDDKPEEEDSTKLAQDVVDSTASEDWGDGEGED